jgi:hypothetical protein
MSFCFLQVIFKSDFSSREAAASAIFGNASTSCVSALYKSRNSSISSSRKESNFNVVNLIALRSYSTVDKVVSRRDSPASNDDSQIPSPRLSDSCYAADPLGNQEVRVLKGYAGGAERQRPFRRD